jgi:oligosaccharide repeat unit polymerase
MLSVSFSFAYTCYRYVIKKPHGLPFIINLQWLILLITYKLNENSFVPLNEKSDLAIFIFIFTFTIVHNLTPSSWTFKVNTPHFIQDNLLYGLAYLASILSFILLINSGDKFTDLMSLRTLVTPEGSEERLSIGVGFSLPLTLTAWILARSKDKKRESYLLGIISFFLAVITTSKIFIMICLLFSIPINIKIKRISFEKIFKIGIISVFGFALLHIALGKFVESDEGLIDSAYKTLISYMLSGIAGFSLYINNEAQFPVNAIWKPIGDIFPTLIDVPESNILPWIQIGDWYGNVYTGLAYWIDGFGYLGMILFIGIIGLTSKIIYSTSSVTMIPIQRLFLFGILITPHQDSFLSSIKIWIGFLICSIILSASQSKIARRMPII